MLAFQSAGRLPRCAASWQGVVHDLVMTSLLTLPQEATAT